MAGFQSGEDIRRFVQIAKLINPLTASAYGPQLDAWGFLAGVSEKLGTEKALVAILKTINPMTVSAYGPMLDMWAFLPFHREMLAQVMRLINPLTAVGYGPLLDEWAKGGSAQ